MPTSQLNRLIQRLVGYGLGRKLTLVFGGLVSGIVLIVLYINVQIQVELVRERINLRSQQLVQLGVEVSLPYLLEGRAAELEVIFEEIANQPEVARVYLLNNENELMVNGSDSVVGGFLRTMDDPLAYSASLEGTQLRIIEDGIEKIAHPIFLGGTSYGIMRLDIRRDTERGEINTVWTRNAVFGFFFILIGMLTSVFIARRMTKPVIYLTEATERAAAGDLHQKIEVKTNDEIESLADSFNMMLERMRNSIQEIHRLAYLDKLTSIPNRAWFGDQIERITVSNASHHKRFAVFFLDIDNFKSINDHYGHDIGDELLIIFARRLIDCVREFGLEIATIDKPYDDFDEMALVARLGGDEFTIVLPANATDPVAKSIVEAIPKTIELGSRRFSISTSIGIGIFPDQAESSHDLLKIADAAMYQAKQAGRNCYRVFNKSLYEHNLALEELQGEIKQAIVRREFEIYLQPQFEVATGRISGAEALVRWRHPSKGLLTPDRFLPVAASAGLMPQIGEETTRLAISALSEIQSFVERPFVVAINLSVEELLEEDFVDNFIWRIVESDVDPRNLEVEITENTAMFDDELASIYFGKLRDLGVRLAIDDFGVGFSNLGRLKSLAFDILKVDKSLLDGVEDREDAAALLVTIFDMARAIDADVVAEGVERPEQLAFLNKLNCRYYQGYYGGRPMPAADFIDWLKSEIDAPAQTASAG